MPRSGNCNEYCGDAGLAQADRKLDEQVRAREPAEEKERRTVSQEEKHAL